MTDWALRSALQGMLDIIVQPRKDPGRLHDPSGGPARYNRRLDPMSLLQANNLGKSYGAHDVLTGVELAVPHQARIALVGRNGVGKSTLLRILAGLDRPDSGRVKLAGRLRVGFLPQEATDSARWQDMLEETLWQSSLDAFSRLREMEAELADLERRMADPRQAEAALARYGHLQETFERAGGYRYQAESQRVLRGLGFDEGQFEVPLKRFSGGERTRALLGRLLLEDSDLLLLDEPTNHLDLDSIEWLESWLASWPGAAVIVSHDRYFLDRTVERVWQLTESGLHSYQGNYEDFVGQRAERQARQLKEYRTHRAYVAKEREYIRRNIAGQNSRQARGRRTRLKRLLGEGAVEAPRSRRTVSIRFGATDRSADIVLQSEGLEIGRRGQALFQVPDLVLRRGERAAIVGPNGVGKTTLLQTLIGQIEPVSGRVNLGAGVSIGYFAQAHAGLEPSISVLEALMEVDPELGDGPARDMLARFGFEGEGVRKTVAALSGGERGRLALARLIAAGGNLLLLDEPTNHLDLESQEVLQAALSEFEGTILLVTHDRYLVNALATQVWSLRPGAESLQVVLGGYQAHLAARERASLKHRAESADEVGAKSRSKKPQGPSVRIRIERIETRIQELEEALEDLAGRIERAGEDREKVRRLGERYASVERELQAHLEEWEQLQGRLEGP